MPRAIADLKLSRSPKSILVKAQSVVTSMTDNAFFPSPTPSLAEVQSDVDQLVTAEATVLTRAKGAREARDFVLFTVRSDLEALRAYVQRVADEDGNNAEIIIASAGMSVRHATHHDKALLAVKNTSVSGVVDAFAKCAGDRAKYAWQYSKDGLLWLDLPATMQSRTRISGLETGARYWFRVRFLTKDGLGEPCDPVSIVVT
jgi:hypothetical protein